MPEQPPDQKKSGDDKPGVYFNAFSINNTLVDFQLRLKLNNTDIETYNMAPVTAKNLAMQLQKVVEKYEKLTGSRIEGFNDLKERTQENLKENEDMRKEQEKKDEKEKEQQEHSQQNQQVQNQ
jgi:hypothetical protein